MAYTPFYNQWVDATYNADGSVATPSPTPLTAASAEAWDDALAAALPQSIKGDLVGYTGTGTDRLPVGANSAALVADATQALGVRWSTTDYVPTSQRGPLGGAIGITYAATVTPNAATSTLGVITATGNLTVNAPSGGVDGQNYMLRVLASGANRTVTFDTPVVLTTNTTRAYTVTSGQRGLFGLHYSAAAGAWLLIAQTQTIAG